MMIKNLRDLENVLSKKVSELDSIPEGYISDAGKAAKEAYKAVLWYTGFYENLQDLIEDKQFNNLLDIPDKHPEYYKVLQKIKHAIERAIQIR